MNRSLVAVADLEESTRSLSIRAVFIGIGIVLVCTAMAVLFKESSKLKGPLFYMMAFTIIAVTAVLSISTVYLNVNSESGGPVHWHADIEVWACNSELEIRNPTGLFSNKIGTATLHEHDDKRIHLEGVVVEKAYDASLGKFMKVIGGELNNESLKVPLNEYVDWQELNAESMKSYFALEQDGDEDKRELEGIDLYKKHVYADANGYAVAEFNNEQTCDSQPSEIQVFVYRINPDNEMQYSQRKLDDPASLVIAPESQVPNGDCIIVEFAPIKDRTDRLCSQYGIRTVELCKKFGVEDDKQDFCALTEVDNV